MNVSLRFSVVLSLIPFYSITVNMSIHWWEISGLFRFLYFRRILSHALILYNSIVRWIERNETQRTI